VQAHAVITYAERVCFLRSHKELLFRVEPLVARVSGAWGNELRCHELARAVHVIVADEEPKLVVVDGKCGPIEHSWLALPDAIIDPYVPGRLPAVQIVDPIVALDYRPGKRRSDIRQAIVAALVLEMHGARVL